MGNLEMCCLISTIFGDFPDTFLLLISSLLHTDQNTKSVLHYGPEYGLSWRMFYVHLKRVFCCVGWSVLQMLVEPSWLAPCFQSSQALWVL